MISIIITAREEPNATRECIKRFLIQEMPEDYEMWGICPDKATKKVILEYKERYPEKIHFMQQPQQGRGKNYMLNKVFKKAKGDIIIMTDGDVFVNENCVREIYEKFRDSKVGSVTGRPVSSNPRNTMLGYWSHLLCDAGAHKIREKKNKEGKYVEGSGYLWAIRAGIVDEMPLDVAEDSITPYMIYKKGYKTVYAPNATATTQFPTDIKGWINQKTRTAKAHEKLGYYMKEDKNLRSKSFLNEIRYGYWAFSYPNNLKEFIWTLLIFPARMISWINYFYNVRIRDEHYGELWTRVKSTRTMD